MPYEMFGGYLFRLALMNGKSATQVSDRARHDKSFFRSLLDYNNLSEDTLYRKHAFVLKRPNIENNALAKAILFPKKYFSLSYSFCELCLEEDFEEYGHTYYRSHLQPRCIFSCPNHNAILSVNSGMLFAKYDFQTGFSPSRELCSESLFKLSRTASNILLQGSLDFDRENLCRLLRLRSREEATIKSSLQSIFDGRSISIIKSRFDRNYSRYIDLYRPAFDNSRRISDAELIFYALTLLGEKVNESLFSIKYPSHELPAAQQRPRYRYI